MKLGNIEIPTEDIGDLVQLEGVLYGDGKKTYALLLPFETGAPSLTVCRPTDEQWHEFLKQTDNPITPVGKAFVKKASRQIDESVKWKVYKRDHYTCRYCGASGVPMTVDHYIAQKFGGLTTYENLLTSCRPCNKKKGHMTIPEWEKYCKANGLKSF